MHRHLFTVVIQLTRLDLYVNTVFVHLFLNVGQVLRHFLIALFHRQLEVENGLTTPAVDQPGGHQRGDFCRLLNHIAHHPRDVVTVRAITETVFTQPGDLPGVHQALRHWAVINGRYPHIAFHQLIGPAARARAKVDGVHAVCQTLIPLIRRDKDVERLFQLERGTAWRIGREAQTRDTHKEGRVVGGVRIACIAAARCDKEDMHHRTLRRFVVRQHARITQRRTQRHGELTAELHQLFTFVGIRHFNAQIAALLHHALQHANNRRDAVFRRKILQQLTRDKHLASEDQRAERQLARQLVCVFSLIALEYHIARVFFYAGKAEDFALRRFIGNFRGALFLKPRATI